MHCSSASKTATASGPVPCLCRCKKNALGPVTVTEGGGTVAAQTSFVAAAADLWKLRGKGAFSSGVSGRDSFFT